MLLGLPFGFRLGRFRLFLFLSSSVLKTIVFISLESITGTDRVVPDLRNRLAARGWHSEVLEPMKLVSQSPFLRRTGLGALMLRLPGKRLLAIAWVEFLLLRRALREGRQITVYSAVYPLWGPGIWLGKATGKLRYYYSIPDLMWRKAYVEDGNWRIFRQAARSGIAAADKILVPTASAQLDILTFLPRRHHAKLNRLSSPIDEVFWRALVAEPVPALAGHRFIFHPAGLKPNKNTPRAIEAFARCEATDVTFVYIANAVNSGRAGTQASLPGTASDPRSAVLRLPALTDGQMKWLYENCAFVSVISIEEGAGLPILEAQAFGKPVVTSCISAMPEVASGRAILVDPFNPADIARGYTEALQMAGGPSGTGVPACDCGLDDVSPNPPIPKPNPQAETPVLRKPQPVFGARIERELDAIFG